MGVQTEVWLTSKKNCQQKILSKGRLCVDQMVAIGRGRWEGRTPLRAGLARCWEFCEDLLTIFENRWQSLTIVGWKSQGVCSCLWMGGGCVVEAKEGGRGGWYWHGASSQAGSIVRLAAFCFKLKTYFTKKTTHLGPGKGFNSFQVNFTFIHTLLLIVIKLTLE